MSPLEQINILVFYVMTQWIIEAEFQTFRSYKVPSFPILKKEAGPACETTWSHEAEDSQQQQSKNYS